VVKGASYWRNRYKTLKIKYLQLQAKYIRLTAKMMKENSQIPDGMVSKKKYLELMSKYRKLQAHIEKLLKEREELRWKIY
jgi:hypothetical protein